MEPAAKIFSTKTLTLFETLEFQFLRMELEIPSPGYALCRPGE